MGKRRSTKEPQLRKLTAEEIEVNLKNLQDYLGGNQELFDFFSKAVHGTLWLSQQVEQGLINIAHLKKLFQIQGSEKPKRRKPNNGGSGSETHSPPKGHGRNTADAYVGATVKDIEHPDFAPGDTCPVEACGGRLYEMSDPGVFVRVIGSPLARAVRYNQQKLRCAVCEAIYTAPLPASAGDKKYDESFASMMMINKYFMSVPFYRQDRLQAYLGMPLPSSTQWDIMYAYKPVMSALYQALWTEAANGTGICYDDTSVKVLEEIQAKKKANKGEKKKHNCFTTGIVSVYEDHQVYVYMTDQRPAGQTVDDLLQVRDKSLPPPILMCDALSANMPPTIAKDLYVLCYCLVHARRQFYELPDGYDDLADKVIELIGNIYDHDVTARTMGADGRLEYHKKHSTPIMDELKAYLESQRDQFEPNGVAGKAIAYILTRFTELSQFLRHADAPLDTNIVERALKLVIQTRKSSMFYKSLSSAEFASHVQSALYSAAQNDVNPHAYMTAILENQDAVIKDAPAWLPWCYKDALKQILAIGAKTVTLSQGTPDSR